MREAPVGVEPTIEDLQSSALPLGYGAVNRVPPPEEERTGMERGGPDATGPGLPSSGRAGNRTRTGDPHLGKVVLYQLSYSRKLTRENPSRQRAPNFPRECT